MWRTVFAWVLILGAVGCTVEADMRANPTMQDEEIGSSSPGASAGDVDATMLESLRRATQRFRDVNVAMAEGYIPDPSGLCVTAEMEGFPRQLGTMGIHYFRPDLLALTGDAPRVSGVGTHVDFMQPGALVYLPRADGSLELAAIENLVWEGAWREAGHTGPPAFEGQEYWHMVDNPLTEDVDEAHGFEPHYELHIWLHRENPSGVFMPFNPAASCDHHVESTGG